MSLHWKTNIFHSIEFSLLCLEGYEINFTAFSPQSAVNKILELTLFLWSILRHMLLVCPLLWNNQTPPCYFPYSTSQIHQQHCFLRININGNVTYPSNCLLYRGYMFDMRGCICSMRQFEPDWVAWRCCVGHPCHHSHHASLSALQCKHLLWPMAISIKQMRLF